MKNSVRFSCIKGGGPGRLRTYDNPVMSRGLYQLSYGSNRRNMPPFPPFGKKKKDVPPGISRTEKLRNIPAPCLPNLPPLRPQSVLPEMGRRAPHSEKNPLPTGSPHSALPRSCDCPFPQRNPCSRKVQRQPRCSEPGRKALQRTSSPVTDRSAFHKRPGTRTASDQPRLFSYRTPCSCAVPDQTHLVLRNTQKKRYPGSPQSACRSHLPGYFSPAPPAPGNRPQKSPLSRRKEGLAPRMAGRDLKIPRPSAGKRRGNNARQETRFLREQPSFRGRRNALLQAIRREVRMQTRRSSAESFPARAFNAYRAWKNSRGCAQAGQDSGASRPSCT